MRKRAIGVDEAKQNVAALMGRRLKISVNKGRKRTARYEGSILGVYPAVFTLKIEGDKTLTSLSCTYSDVICGDVKLKAT